LATADEGADAVFRKLLPIEVFQVGMLWRLCTRLSGSWEDWVDEDPLDIPNGALRLLDRGFGPGPLCHPGPTGASTSPASTPVVSTGSGTFLSKARPWKLRDGRSAHVEHSWTPKASRATKEANTMILNSPIELTGWAPRAGFPNDTNPAELCLRPCASCAGPCGGRCVWLPKHEGMCACCGLRISHSVVPLRKKVRTNAAGATANVSGPADGHTSASSSAADPDTVRPGWSGWL
jgi:hypothetical protein